MFPSAVKFGGESFVHGEKWPQSYGKSIVQEEEGSFGLTFSWKKYEINIVENCRWQLICVKFLRFVAMVELCVAVARCRWIWQFFAVRCLVFRDVEIASEKVWGEEIMGEIVSAWYVDQREKQLRPEKQCCARRRMITDQLHYASWDPKAGEKVLIPYCN